MFQFNGIFYEDPNTRNPNEDDQQNPFLALTPEEFARIPLDQSAKVMFDRVGIRNETAIAVRPTYVSQRLQNLNCVWATPVGDINVHVLMATHARLGRDSLLRHIDQEILVKILEIAKPTRE